MKDFSNETKKVRKNTRLKENLKNYSVIAWLPISVCIYYVVGRIEFYIARSIVLLSYPSIVNAIIYIAAGFFSIVLLLTVIFVIVYIKVETSNRKTVEEKENNIN